jgi:hypothetical protein
MVVTITPTGNTTADVSLQRPLKCGQGGNVDEHAPRDPGEIWRLLGAEWHDSGHAGRDQQRIGPVLARLVSNRADITPDVVTGVLRVTVGSEKDHVLARRVVTFALRPPGPWRGSKP